MAIEIILPTLFAINSVVNGNTVQQVIQPSRSIQADKSSFTSGRIRREILIPENTGDAEQILLVSKRKDIPATYSKIILATNTQTSEAGKLDLSSDVWLKHPLLREPDNHAEHLSNTLKSWRNGFVFIEEDELSNIKGLREPQDGAIHAVKGHWAVTNDTATIVMPTGTGKTETMISVSVASQCQKILIVVPTDALRTQLANKFLTFGVLKDFGVIAPACLYPIVGVLKRKPKTIDEVDDLFARCTVIVSTSHIVGQSDESIQERMAHHCSVLFIDEAHHVGADTWKGFKKQFAARRILQFTATPYREDDKPVEGKNLYKYPLSRAQEKGYFTKINFKPVRVFARKKRDQVIAESAVKQLREDLKSYSHILMARVNTIARAEEVFKIYKQYEEFNPVIIHSRVKKKDGDEIKRKLFSGESKIVVCVDMLGEGFDLPELKIAAFHDIKKSPTITIQLAGRFTRTRDDLGEATFIANVGDEEVRSELKKLYTRDTDWNFLLPQLSDELIQEQVNLSEFAEGFKSFPKEIPVHTLSPALSTVIYKTKCEEWTPENFLSGLIGVDSFEKQFHDINEERHTLVVITTRKISVPWTKIEDVFNWDWSLYVVFWDKEQNLLFINNSSNGSDFKRLAQAVAGDDATLIKGDDLFRCFGNMTRITFNNVGLSEHLGRMVSYTGRMGSDVAPVLTEIQKQRASKSVLVGTGFENSEKISVGCSAKGRVWSHARSAYLNKLTEWCSYVGKKVLDETIDSNDFLNNTLVSTFVSARPAKMPFGIDWHEDIHKSLESSVTFKFGGDIEKQLYEVDINLLDPTDDGALRFEVASEDVSSQFTLVLHSKNQAPDYYIENDPETKLIVEWGASHFSGNDFFNKYPPTIWFVDGSGLSGTKFTASIKGINPYAPQRIQTWDWKTLGVDIRKESQHLEKRTDSIQYCLIQELKKGHYDVIFDDDAAGEAADVVTIKVKEALRTIEVEFYHCKYSTEDKPGARVKELYEVCGQSQKSIRWLENNATELFRHLLRREEKRQDENSVSRIEIGDVDKIDEIKEKSIIYRTELKIFVVQPGLSKRRVSSDQLELLGATESYLKETYMIPFFVIGSE